MERHDCDAYRAKALSADALAAALRAVRRHLYGNDLSCPMCEDELESALTRHRALSGEGEP